jgi:hypothetical protein
MKRDLTSPEIISDLLTENWELRWQALETFSQVQLSVRNHARTSQEFQAVRRLGKRLARTLNGANDRNLHLVMTAAYFLGGNDFILDIFHHLGLDDSDEFYPELNKIKRDLRKESGKLYFYDYFMCLFQAHNAVESSTAIAATLAINIFSAPKAFELVIAIPDPELRSLNLELLQQTHPQHNFKNFIKTRPEDQASLDLLLSASSSWRRKKRLAALSDLGFIATSAAVDILRQRADKGDHNERRIALTALAGNSHPQAFAFLMLALKETKTNSERRFLLNLFKNHPQARPDAAAANLLAQWHDQEELYPELLEALAVFGYGELWEDIICGYKPPLLPRQQEVALFMARFSENPAIGKTLLNFLDDRDWNFSFQILTVLQKSFTGSEFKLLFDLLKQYESGRKLTIREKLIQGDNIPDFDTALTDFLNTNPNIATGITGQFITELMEGTLPSSRKLRADFTRQPDAIQKLCLGTEDNAAARAQASLPRLHILRLLDRTSLTGGNALAAVINRTRQYNGYLRHIICSILDSIFANDPRFQNSDGLNDLEQILDFIRQRPHYDALRSKILQQIATITRQAKDIRIESGGSHNRCLRVLSIKYLKPVKVDCENL